MTLLKAWKYRQNYKPIPGSEFSSWIYTILRREAGEYARVKRGIAEVGVDDVAMRWETGGSGDEKLAYLGARSAQPDDGLSDETLRALSKIGARERTMFQKIAEGGTYAELAEEHNMPIGTVRSTLNRARYVCANEMHDQSFGWQEVSHVRQRVEKLFQRRGIADKVFALEKAKSVCRKNSALRVPRKYFRQSYEDAVASIIAELEQKNDARLLRLNLLNNHDEKLLA